MTVPCSDYISKIVKFDESHYDFGELYMESIYGNCMNYEKIAAEAVERFSNVRSNPTSSSGPGESSQLSLQGCFRYTILGRRWKFKKR